MLLKMSFLVSRRLLLNFRLFPTRTEASREPVDLADVSDAMRLKNAEAEQPASFSRCEEQSSRYRTMSAECKRSTVRVWHREDSTPLRKTFVGITI